MGPCLRDKGVICHHAMPTPRLDPTDLCLTVPPESLDFTDTSALLMEPRTWVGQEAAQAAAHFGLAMLQPNFHLFVLGEEGTGGSSMLRDLMQAAARSRPVPPDLCYLHNFDEPVQALALRVPAGQGRRLRERMDTLLKSLQDEIPQRLAGPDVRAEADRIRKDYALAEARIYGELQAFAQARSFVLHREQGQLIFTLVDPQGAALTEVQAQGLTRERRGELDLAEQELQGQIAHFLDQTRPLLRVMNQRLQAMRQKAVRPLLAQAVLDLQQGLDPEVAALVRLTAWLTRACEDILQRLDLYSPTDSLNPEEEEDQGALETVVSRYRVNLVVDNAGLSGAPVLLEYNPTERQLFGGIEYLQQEDSLVSDFSRIRAGSLLRAHGGYLMLPVQDLLAEEGVWARLRRFLRSGQLQMDEPGTLILPMTAQSMRPEPVAIEVKLVLLGSGAMYRELQDADPEFIRYFSVKVELTPSFHATAQGYRACAVWLAYTCSQRGLPPLSAAAVARVLEQSHREEGDQSRQSANFARSRALVLEAAELVRGGCGVRVEQADIDAALAAVKRRHQALQQRLLEAALEGDRLITVSGSAVGQVNALTLIDQGDYRFGLPVRVSARTYAGGRGLLNVEREVELSGPVHDKGVLILQAYLAGLFADLAPLALQASLVFEQEYQGIEGDSASCAECMAILSSLSGLPLRQGIALTGALNQHGEVMPVEGVNEKIEGFFQLCEATGLDGTQGVLLPQRNRRHLMLARPVVQAVSQGRFHIYTMTEASDALALLTGLKARQVLVRARRTLLAFRRACQRAVRGKPGQNR